MRGFGEYIRIQEGQLRIHFSFKLTASIPVPNEYALTSSTKNFFNFSKLPLINKQPNAIVKLCPIDLPLVQC